MTASVSNFVPKPHTPYQWNGMQTREYLHWARNYLLQARRIPAVENQVPSTIEISLVEGVLSRGDRRDWPATSSWPGSAVPGWIVGANNSTRLVGGRPARTATSTFEAVLHRAEPLDARLALGPHQRSQGAYVPGKGAGAIRAAIGHDGGRSVGLAVRLRRFVGGPPARVKSGPYSPALLRTFLPNGTLSSTCDRYRRHAGQ